MATASGSTVDAFRRFDEDGAIGTDSERGAERLLRLRRSDRDGDDFLGAAFFLEADRFFDGDFVEWVHRHLDVRQVDSRAIRLDANFDVVIDDALDRHNDLHAFRQDAWRSPVCCFPRFRTNAGFFAARHSPRLNDFAQK